MTIVLGAVLIYASYALSVFLRLYLNGPDTPRWARRSDFSSSLALALTTLTAFGVALLATAALTDEGALRVTEIAAAVAGVIVAGVATSKTMHRIYPHDVERHLHDRTGVDVAEVPQSADASAGGRDGGAPRRPSGGAKRAA